MMSEERSKIMDNLIAQDADLIDDWKSEAGKLEVTQADRDLLISVCDHDEEAAEKINAGEWFTWEVEQIARHRLAERAAIVAWLRSDRIVLSMDGSVEDVAASAIEAGSHLK